MLLGESAFSSRFTFDPSNNPYPIWSPDGSRIVFASNRDGPFNLYQKASSGAGNDEALLKSDVPKTPLDWSRDGRFIVYRNSDPKTGLDLWMLPLAGDRKPIPFLQTEFNETAAQFSPDGRWIAYASDESGRYEVYVRPFNGGPAAGGKWLISSNGGNWPKWRGDGKELFYLAADGKLMAVEVKGDSSAFEAADPKPLFETRTRGLGPVRGITADGKQFLINTEVAEATSSPITVVLNWTTGLKR